MSKIIPGLIVFLLFISTSAHAYLGPGMGGGIIAAVLGVIASIFLAVFGVLYYPIKRALKNKKSKNSEK